MEAELTASRSSQQGEARFEWLYRPRLPADQFLAAAPEREPPQPVRLAVAPGFEAVRLPFEMEMMPTALAWRKSEAGHELLVTSLKGRVWRAEDSDGDQLEDRVGVLADDLAAPFGVAAAQDAHHSVDIVNKYALLRLIDQNGDGEADRWETLASGWGHTADYHDWAIGLCRDSDGGYYIATACQQDERSEAAARLRGVVMRLAPREPTADNPHRFAIEPISRGHRFPIGIARDRRGRLLVTDNQGNYNPFNELNHVLPGRHYGFINKLDRDDSPRPPLTPPAVKIPHPWTRSVNGICFLESPDSSERNSDFGLYEGHLVGCEYDTRRLIRISLEEVGGQLQGAAYPLTRTEPGAEPLLGPLCCAVSPRGELYVGCIRDSGWGGSNNVGTVVRLQMAPDSLPAGLAEVRAAKEGLTLKLHGAIDWQAAADPENYVISSYRRESTPAYGGDDKDRRVESVKQVEVDADAASVRLRLGELRAGYVYELNVRSLAAEGKLFFPAEAHYSMNATP